jgi:hypothetical protein
MKEKVDTNEIRRKNGGHKGKQRKRKRKYKRKTILHIG